MLFPAECVRSRKLRHIFNGRYTYTTRTAVWATALVELSPVLHRNHGWSSSPQAVTENLARLVDRDGFAVVAGRTLRGSQATINLIFNRFRRVRFLPKVCKTELARARARESCCTLSRRFVRTIITKTTPERHACADKHTFLWVRVMALSLKRITRTHGGERAKIKG